MTISPFDPLRFPRYPLNNITPFTYRDGRTFLELIEELRQYLNDTVIPGINASIDTLLNDYAFALSALISQGNTKIETIQSHITAFNLAVAAAADLAARAQADANTTREYRDQTLAIRDNIAGLETSLNASLTELNTQIASVPAIAEQKAIDTIAANPAIVQAAADRALAATNMHMYGTPISTGADLNTLLTPGIYRVQSASVVNAPRATVGVLEVMPQNAVTGVIQRFTIQANIVYTRTYISGVWTTWKRQTWQGVDIPVGTDIDTVVESGLYRVVSGLTPNLPTSFSGYLEVFSTGSGNVAPVQRYTVYDSVVRIFVRTQTNSVWNPWYAVTWYGHLSSSSDLNTVTQQGIYSAGNSTIANLPVAAVGSLEVLKASGLTIQRFVSAYTNVMYIRNLNSGSVWSEWREMGGADPALTAAVNSLSGRVTALETGDTTGLRPIPVLDTPAMSFRSVSDVPVLRDSTGRNFFNAYGTSVKRSRDGGETWSVLYSFNAEFIEAAMLIDDTSAIVSTSQSSLLRKVYKVTGLDGNAATVKFLFSIDRVSVRFGNAWSMHSHDNIVLLAEYGPKSGQTWQDATEITPVNANARYVYLSTDYGDTFTPVFDLNDYLLNQLGRTHTDVQHMHGVAYDHYWRRIWVSYGDNFGGLGSNGIAYSDDLGSTWYTAHQYSGPQSESWQVTTIVPMPGGVVFGGDVEPSGVMVLNRSQGKHKGLYNFTKAYEFTGDGTHLCQASNVVDFADGGKLAYLGFGSENNSGPSFIIATRDGLSFTPVWTDTVNHPAGYGLRYIAGPTQDNRMIWSQNDLRSAGNFTQFVAEFTAI